MTVINHLEIDSKFYRQERIRPKKESFIILPKQEKMAKNAQIVLTIKNFELSEDTLLQSIYSLLEKWENVFKAYPIFRVFCDKFPDNIVRIMISFNTPLRLLENEGDIFLGFSTKNLEIFFNKQMTIENDERSSLELMDKELDKQEHLLNSLLDNEELIRSTDTVNTMYSSMSFNEQLSKEDGIQKHLKMDGIKLFNDFHNTMDKTKEKLEEQISLNKNSAKIISQLKAKLSTADKEIKIQNETNNNNTAIINELNEGLVSLKKTVQAQTEIIDSNANTIEELKENVKLSKETITAQSKIIDSDATTIDKLKERLELSTETIESKTEIIDSKVAHINELEEKLDYANKEIKHQNKINSSHQTIIDGMKESLEASKATIESQTKVIDSHVNQINELEKKLDYVNEGIKHQAEINTNDQMTIDELKERLELSEETVKSQTKVIDSHVNQINELEKKLDYTNKEIKYQTEINTDNQLTIDELKENLESFQEIIASQTNVINDSRSTSDEVTREIIDKENGIMSTFNKSENYSRDSETYNVVTGVNEKELIGTLKDISTDWEQLYKLSEVNYQQIKGQHSINKKIKYSASEKSISKPESSKVSSINTKVKNEKNILTPQEIELLELFENYDSSKHNKTISIDVQKYNNYMTNLQFLPLIWQNVCSKDSNQLNKTFKQTLQPFIDELNVTLDDISVTTKSAFLNKSKVTFGIDDLKLLEAYEALLKYVSKLKVL